MADEQPTNGGNKTEIEKTVDNFFNDVEIAMKTIGVSIASFAAKIFSLKFDSVWSKERELMKDRIKKGLTDNEPKS
jgi:hypothetical protein